MKKLFFIAVCLLCVVSWVNAETEEYGPVPNYKGTKETSTGLIIAGTQGFYITNNINGEVYKIGGHSGAEFWVDHPTPVFVDSYAYTDTPPGVPFNPDTNDFTLTEIYALDLQPGLDANLVPDQTGFDPVDPEIGPTGAPGYYEDLDGNQYPATVETWTVADLPTRLPGYDVTKIGGSPSAKVYVMQATMPAADFAVKPFDFTYEHMGYFEQSDPCWIGPKDPEYPYQHYWQLTIHEWSDIQCISDVHIEEAWALRPGSVTIVPPDDWSATGPTFGRAGYQANTGGEITVGGGSLGIEWRVNGKLPQVIPGQVILTTDNIPSGKVMSTMVPERNADAYCGDWGYAEGDVDNDCDVDLTDVAIMANNWLTSTDPAVAGSVCETIVAVGFAFDGEDMVGPATIGDIFDDTTCAGILDPNDIIVEYRGHQVSCGLTLMRTIETLPDVSVGQPVPMWIIKEGASEATYVIPLAQEIEVKDRRKSGEGMRCVAGWITPSTKKTCSCIPDTVNCACAKGVKKGKNGKVIKYQTHCSDSSGAVCHGDWIDVK